MRIKLLFTKEDYEKLKQCKENGYRSGCSVMSCGEIGCDVCPLSGLLIDERLEYVKNRLEEENNLEPVKHGHWVLEAEHFFGDYGECEVYVVASCSECEKKWHNNGIVFNRTLYDYDNNDMPDPITDDRIKKCKEYCLQEAEKYLLTETPFCELCGAKMDGKEEDEEIKNV